MSIVTRLEDLNEAVIALEAALASSPGEAPEKMIAVGAAGQRVADALLALNVRRTTAIGCKDDTVCVPRDDLDRLIGVAQNHMSAAASPFLERMRVLAGSP